ncbi:hypothetical protein RHGRI_004888 [Rhododendron griersonianum]|uniref:Protein FAR1-RELATED SEQUENCE n=1 Tax=Rhododendron griersonianum TaxID=479676 RepID=A0AAV6LAA8_9ERIC|nr:hypothetical protein RHGRI_004888 [Rhododendron griersonianum]
MDDDGEDNELQSTTLGFTYEDFSELNDIINLTATSNIEEISELYKSFNCTNESGKQMPKVDNVESNGLKSLLNEDFSTREELLDRVRNVALKEGYVTVIKRSKAGRYVIIGCDRGGKFRCTVPLDEMKRISATRLINCPFEVLGKKKVGKHPHFGNRVTSRVEGAHAMLKKYLTVSTSNFREVREKICLAIDNQYNEIKTKVASEKIRVTHKFKIPMLKELVTHVSVFALGELFKQCELARTDYVLGSCTGNFSRTMGLPCAHMMRNKKDGILRLGDIHPQWRIDTRSFTNMDGGAHRTGSEIECLLKNFHEKCKNMPLVQKEESLKQIALLVDAEIPLTLEPNVQPHKGRPLGSKKRKGDSSTTRHPSAFEIVEKTRKCGACQCVGHNRRTCPGNSESNSHNPHFVVANQDATLNMLETPFQCEINTSLGL